MRVWREGQHAHDLPDLVQLAPLGLAEVLPCVSTRQRVALLSLRPTFQSRAQSTLSARQGLWEAQLTAPDPTPRDQDGDSEMHTDTGRQLHSPQPEPFP